MVVRKGLAFVIANSKYQYQPPLNCCFTDGIDMCSTLKDLQFDVIKAFDLTRGKVYEKIEECLNIADSYSTILFYYSGHGRPQN